MNYQKINRLYKAVKALMILQNTNKIAAIKQVTAAIEIDKNELETLISLLES